MLLVIQIALGVALGLAIANLAARYIRRRFGHWGL